MYLQMVFQVRLSQEHTIAVLMRTAELLWLLVDFQMLGKLLLGGKGLAASLTREGGGEKERERREIREMVKVCWYTKR